MPMMRSTKCGRRSSSGKGPRRRGLIKGKKWLLQSRWKNLTQVHRGELNRLFQLNRRVFKAYLLKESLERLWNYRYRGAMLNSLNQWMEKLKWQRRSEERRVGKECRSRG